MRKVKVRVLNERERERESKDGALNLFSNAENLGENAEFSNSNAENSHTNAKFSNPNSKNSRQNSQTYTKHFPAHNCELKVDFKNQRLIYPANTNADLSAPNGIIIHNDFTCNFSDNENFVVFECVCRLLEKGYKPQHIELEPKWNLGHSPKSGRADILVRDQQKSPYLFIECKTTDAKNSEFNKEWARMQNDGGQLFSYLQQERSVKFLCLYTSDFHAQSEPKNASQTKEFTNQILKNGAQNESQSQANPSQNEPQSTQKFTNHAPKIKYENYIINMTDNEKTLKDEQKQGYKDAQNVQQLVSVWKNTYGSEKQESGIFEPRAQAYNIAALKPTLENLHHIDSATMQKKRHEWATILRAHAVGDRGVALNKFMNLLLCKITDELENAQDLHFAWRGKASDTAFDLVDRLQKLYQTGMQKFLKQQITYHSQDSIDKAFSKHFKNTSVRNAIYEIFKDLKYYSNGDFNFIEVYNKEQFNKNFAILLPMVQNLENIRFTGTQDGNILGDYFETYIHDMPQQEGQYFTPVPLVNFIIHSLPKLPRARVLDFSCGAGHFLTQYAQIHKANKQECEFTGIDKDSRLAKIAKIASFMHGLNANISANDSLKKDMIKEHSCSILISNPPYSVDGFLANLDENDRKDYELFGDFINAETNDQIQCFFIEKAAKALQNGGLLALVLPNSILSKTNATDIKTREILLRDFEIIALCEFGNQTFFKTGTQPIILFALKKPQKEPTQTRESDIFEDFAHALNEGKFEDISNIYDNFTPHFEAFCEFRGFDKGELKALFTQNLQENSPLLESETFKEYRAAYEAMLAKEKAAYAKKSASHKAKNPFAPSVDFEHFAANKESEKFLYFCHCFNSHPIIVKAPQDSAKQQKFLGYKWSNTKGQQGIQYLPPATSINSISTPLYNPANCLDSGKLNYYILQKKFLGYKWSNTKGQQGIQYLPPATSINSISTPLYNPANCLDSGKLNYYILQNFKAHLGRENSQDFAIPPELAQYAFKARLVDMIDFSRADFGKAISLNPAFKSTALGNLQNVGNAVAANPFANSKFELVKLGEICDLNKFANQTSAEHIASMNLGSGNVKLLPSSKNYDWLTSEEVAGEFLNEGEVIALGVARYANIKKCKGKFVSANNKLISIKDEIKGEILFDYIYEILVLFGQRLYKQSSQYPQFDKKLFDTFKLPKPPREIQLKIVAECEEVEKQFQTIRMSVDEYQRLIKAILIKCGVCEPERERERESRNAQNIDEQIAQILAALETSLATLCHSEGATATEESTNAQSANFSLLQAQNAENSAKLNTLDLSALKTLIRALPTPPPQGWERVKLGEICKMYQPQTITAKEIKESGEFKVYGANGVIGFYDKYNHENSEVAMTCRGATCGTINFTEPKCWITGNAMVITPLDENKVKKLYLKIALPFADISSVITGAAQPQITRTNLEVLKIPLPKETNAQESIIKAVEWLENAIFALNSAADNLAPQKAQILQKYLF